MLRFVPFLILMFLTLVCGFDPALARDFSGSVQTVGAEIRNVMMVLGPVMLMISGAFFYFSRHVGLSMLISAAIGTIVFAAASTIFMLLYRAFN